MRAIYLIIGLGAGNFVAQAILGHDLSVAADRTFFQALAVLVAHLFWPK